MSAQLHPTHCMMCGYRLHTALERTTALCAICGLRDTLNADRIRAAAERHEAKLRQRDKAASVRWCQHGYLRQFCTECLP